MRELGYAYVWPAEVYGWSSWRRRFSSALAAVRRRLAREQTVLSETSLFVLPRGRTDLALEVLDEYSVSDCQYRRTIRLPQKVVAMTASEGVFYFAMMDPAPTILAARKRR